MNSENENLGILTGTTEANFATDYKRTVKIKETDIYVKENIKSKNLLT